MSSSFTKKTEDQALCVGVIGLGYVGLPLVLSYAAKGYKVIGFDVDLAKIGHWAPGKATSSTSIRRRSPSMLVTVASRSPMISRGSGKWMR